MQRLQAGEGNLRGNSSTSWSEVERSNSFLDDPVRGSNFWTCCKACRAGRQHEDRGFVKLGALVGGRKEVSLVRRTP